MIFLRPYSELIEYPSDSTLDLLFKYSDWLARTAIDSPD